MNVVALKWPRQWSKPCPGRDAIRRGEREYEGKQCPTCGSRRRYSVSGACVLCHRAYCKSNVQPMPFDPDELEQATQVLSLDCGPEISMAIKFLLSSIVQGTSGPRISNATGIPMSKAQRFARRCRDNEMWEWGGIVNYEWLEEGENSWFAIILDAMVLTDEIRRKDRKYYPRT